MMHASSSTVILDFNSRLLAETNGFLLSGVMCQRISTRVSLGRRTGAAVQGAALARYFNSRLRKETNQIPFPYGQPLFKFQLTSPQGDEL